MLSITNSKMFLTAKSAIKTTLGSIMPFLGLTLLLASSHWILIRTYSTYCAPAGLSGLIYTWFSTGSPVCQFINHLQVGLANNFVAIWAAAAAAMVLWIAARLSSGKPVVSGQIGLNDAVPMANTHH